ncbi:MAG: sigma-70 family RNA polymerase sigma factor [Cryomorphaceae bacterium]
MEEGKGMEERPIGSSAQRDQAWVDRALKGDQSAYTELLETYRENIYYMMMKMVRNADDAEDLTIEAFGKAFKRLPSFNPEYAFSTWLFRIASNNAIDFIRKKKKASTFSIDQEMDDDEGRSTFDVKSEGLNPEQAFMKGQRIEEIHKIINALKPKYKQLVELRYLKEYSYDEIAEEMDLPLGTVKAQLFRARELMFEIIKHKGKHF